MKKKIIITLLLSLICAFGAMFTVACSSTGSNGSENPNGEVTAPVDNTDDAIKNLQQQIADLQVELKNLLTEIESLKTDNESLSANVEKMETEIKNLSDRLDGLELKSYGQFYTLKEAYDNEILTTADLEQIANYVNEDLRFPEALDGDEESLIKKAFAYFLRHREEHPTEEAKAEGIEIYSYYGNYADSYVFKVRTGYWDFPAMPIDYWEEIGGVEFHITGYEIIYVWNIK